MVQIWSIKLHFFLYQILLFYVPFLSLPPYCKLTKANGQKREHNGFYHTYLYVHCVLISLLWGGKNKGMYASLSLFYFFYVILYCAHARFTIVFSLNLYTSFSFFLLFLWKKMCGFVAFNMTFLELLVHSRVWGCNFERIQYEWYECISSEEKNKHLYI